MSRRSRWSVIICMAGAAVPFGCAQQTPQVTSALFFPAGGSKNTALPDVEHATTAADQQAESTDAVSPPKAVILTPLTPRPLDQVQPLDALPATVAIAATPAGPIAGPSTEPSTGPSTQAIASSSAATTAPAAGSETTAIAAPDTTGTSKGVYMTVGGVIAKVNGTPIYTSQVLRRLEKEFSVKARSMGEVDFRNFASEEIFRQLKEMIQDEVVFNQSLNSLDEKDRQLCDQIAIHIKQEKITAAGGSLEMAKQRAADDGQDFDDLMKQEYRDVVHQLVNRRVIEPAVQVTADDMRAFYVQNLPKLYSEESKAKFRVIQIDPAAQKGSDPEAAAAGKINDLRNRALNGEDFIRMASSENTDDYLRSRAGDPGGWMGQNSYRLEDVEKAVWQLQPGQITPVIKTEGAYYIAKLEDKRIGVIRAFDDPAVQEDIYNRIWQRQIADRWHQNQEASQMDATITASEDRLDVAVDIAMQQYPTWASK